MTDSEAAGSGNSAGTVVDARTSLLSAARKVFARSGFEAASTREILRLAGVTAPTLYHYFGNKAGLYVAVVDEVNAEISRALERAAVGRTAFLDQLDALFEATVAVHARDSSLVDFVAAARVEMRRHPELRVARESRSDPVTELIHEMCRRSTDLAVDSEVAAAAVTVLFAGLSRVTPGMRSEQVRDLMTSLRLLARGALVLPD